MSKTVFITGASSGIGYACAEAFARRGYRLILTARRKDRLEEISQHLKKNHGAEVLDLVFDVRDRNAVFAAVASIPEGFADVDILINNAGLALGLSDWHNGDLDDWEQMIDTNIKGLLYVSKALIPVMIGRNSGHIINIGSIAGRETYPKGNVYCATKHAVASLTKAMRIELVSHSIKVTQVSPGATETEFSKVRFKGDENRAKDVYKGYQPLTAEDIAKCVEFCTELPAHVNIDDMLVMPTAQAAAGIIHKIID
jgi:NADP-dependent 3-hydroxy acid dehydrogenase YdfG